METSGGLAAHIGVELRINLFAGAAAAKKCLNHPLFFTFIKKRSTIGRTMDSKVIWKTTTKDLLQRGIFSYRPLFLVNGVINKKKILLFWGDFFGGETEFLNFEIAQP